MNLDDPRIDKYLDHELSEAEKKEFLKEIEKFPEVKRYVAFKEFIVQGIQSEGAEELKEYIKTRVSDESTESQTTYWLYAVASVAFLLVGYFFITQYIRSGSFETAKNVITLQEGYIPPKVFSPRYKAPVIGQFDTSGIDKTITADSNSENLYANSADADALNSESNLGPDGQADVRPSLAPESKWAESDIHTDRGSEKQSALADQEDKDRKEGKPVIAQRNQLAEPASDKVIGGANHVLKSVNLVAINLSPTSATLSESVTVSKSKGKVVMADTTLKDVTSVQKPTKMVTKQKYRLVFVESPNKTQRIESKSAGSILEISFINISGENPLLYSIQNKLYVEMAPGFIYEVPSVAGETIDNPKTVTDKKILKIINN